jgi:hypothetical protein
MIDVHESCIILSDFGTMSYVWTDCVPSASLPTHRSAWHSTWVSCTIHLAWSHSLSWQTQQGVCVMGTHLIGALDTHEDYFRFQPCSFCCSYEPNTLDINANEESYAWWLKVLDDQVGWGISLHLDVFLFFISRHCALLCTSYIPVMFLGSHRDGEGNS